MRLFAPSVCYQIAFGPQAGGPLGFSECFLEPISSCSYKDAIAASVVDVVEGVMADSVNEFMSKKIPSGALTAVGMPRAWGNGGGLTSWAMVTRDVRVSPVRAQLPRSITHSQSPCSNEHQLHCSMMSKRKPVGPSTSSSTGGADRVPHSFCATTSVR